MAEWLPEEAQKRAMQSGSQCCLYSLGLCILSCNAAPKRTSLNAPGPPHCRGKSAGKGHEQSLSLPALEMDMPGNCKPAVNCPCKTA